MLQSEAALDVQLVTLLVTVSETHTKMPVRFGICLVIYIYIYIHACHHTTVVYIRGNSVSIQNKYFSRQIGIDDRG